jgi:hypothetical protein
MSYRQFKDADNLLTQFDAKTNYARLFDNITPLQPSSRLVSYLEMREFIGAVSEKSRCELIVMPILGDIAMRYTGKISLHSGITMEGDKTKGLTGECDFLFSAMPDILVLRAPVFAITEAKKQDFELGLPQCMAQLLGAQLYNKRKNRSAKTIFGCVTTGNEWQFLKLEENLFTIDTRRYFFNELPEILGVLKYIVEYK